MTNLYDYIESSAHRDADGSWKWQDNGSPVPAVAHHDVANFIRQSSNPSRVKLLPVRTWAKYPKERIITTIVGPDPLMFSENYARNDGIPINRNVYKLNYTNNTEEGPANTLKIPSIFISPESGEDKIKKGDEFILVDDTMASGGTFRDLIRHINNRGGKVIGYIQTMSSRGREALNEATMKKEITEKLYAVLWALEQERNKQASKEPNGSSGQFTTKPDPFSIWKQISEDERSAFINKIEKSADNGLKVASLTVDQLSLWEIYALGDMLERLWNRKPNIFDKPNSYSSMEEFWRDQGEAIAYPKLSPEEIKSPEKLSTALGIEPKSQWTHRAGHSRNGVLIDRRD